jgi:hypothetical protein
MLRQSIETPKVQVVLSRNIGIKRGSRTTAAHNNRAKEEESFEEVWD